MMQISMLKRSGPCFECLLLSAKSFSPRKKMFACRIQKVHKSRYQSFLDLFNFVSFLYCVLNIFSEIVNYELCYKYFYYQQHWHYIGENYS